MSNNPASDVAISWAGGDEPKTICTDPETAIRAAISDKPGIFGGREGHLGMFVFRHDELFSYRGNNVSAADDPGGLMGLSQRGLPSALRWLRFDLDATEGVRLHTVAANALALSRHLKKRYGTAVVVNFSGKRGCHASMRVPLKLAFDVLTPDAAAILAKLCCKRAGVMPGLLDPLPYAAGALLRLPNSPHPSGIRAFIVSDEELLRMSDGPGYANQIIKEYGTLPSGHVHLLDAKPTPEQVDAFVGDWKMCFAKAVKDAGESAREAELERLAIIGEPEPATDDTPAPWDGPVTLPTATVPSGARPAQPASRGTSRLLNARLQDIMATGFPRDADGKVNSEVVFKTSFQLAANAYEIASTCDIEDCIIAMLQPQWDRSTGLPRSVLEKQVAAAISYVRKKRGR